jgi:hypothetical protein
VGRPAIGDAETIEYSSTIKPGGGRMLFVGNAPEAEKVFQLLKSK